MKMSEKIKNNNGEKEKRLMEGGSGTENTNRKENENESFRPYPKPLAKYSDVIADKALFMHTLEKFHSAMKTKFMIPIIGGKDLDLHQLFREVTSRGGIEKVIGARKWKDVTASFTFPSTATNASYILRKYYFSLLQHYEQLYFFGSHGCNNITDDIPSPVTQGPLKRETTFDSRTLSQKRKIRDEPTLPVNQLVTGAIDGKFDYGYFITVTIGSQTLRGMLYHCPNPPPPHTIVPPQPIIFNSGPSFMAGSSNPRPGSLSGPGSGSPGFGGRRQRRRRKRRPSTMDPNHPKPNRSGYNFFFAEQHAHLKPLHPGKDREISRMIGERWNSLTESEKNIYQERGRVDKQRYQSELALYKEKQRTVPSHVISDAVPINQRPASGTEFTVEGVDIKVEEGDLVLANNDDSDGTNDSEDGDKNEDLDQDTGSGSESDTSLDTTLVRVERKSTDVVGPSQQRGADGFELRKREGVGPSIEVESKMVDDFSKSVDGDMKMCEGDTALVQVDVSTSAPVEVDVEATVEGDLAFNNPVKDDVKTGEGFNDPAEGDVKTLNDPVQDNVKIVEGSNDAVDGGEDLDNPVEADVKMDEAIKIDLIEGGTKTGEDSNNTVESDDPLNGGDDFDNVAEGDVKMAHVSKNTVSCDVKTGEDLNSLAVGDFRRGEDVNNPQTAPEVTGEEKMVDNT